MISSKECKAGRGWWGSAIPELPFCFADCQTHLYATGQEGSLSNQELQTPNYRAHICSSSAT